MNPKKALKYAMDLCSRQERCKSEIAGKLALFEIPDDEAAGILDRLEEEGFINETRYAAAYSRDKLHLNKWGRVKIRHMLLGKKIPEAIIENALAEIDEEQYADILREEMARKRKSIRGKNAFEMRGKLFRFAQQRGFETGLIYRVLDEIL